MGSAIFTPTIDGRTFFDSLGKDYILIYYDDVFVDMEGDDSPFVESVVLFDTEWDVLVIPKSRFDEEFSEAPESTITEDLFD